MSLLQSNKVLKGDAPRLGRQPSYPKSNRQDNVKAVIRLADSYAVFTGRGGRALMQKNRESLSRDVLLQIVADREQTPNFAEQGISWDDRGLFKRGRLKRFWPRNERWT